MITVKCKNKAAESLFANELAKYKNVEVTIEDQGEYVDHKIVEALDLKGKKINEIYVIVKRMDPAPPHLLGGRVYTSKSEATVDRRTHGLADKTPSPQIDVITLEKYLENSDD